MQTDGSPLAGTSRRLIYSGVAAVLVLLMLSFRGDAQAVAIAACMLPACNGCIR